MNNAEAAARVPGGEAVAPEPVGEREEAMDPPVQGVGETPASSGEPGRPPEPAGGIEEQPLRMPGDLEPSLAAAVTVPSEVGFSPALAGMEAGDKAAAVESGGSAGNAAEFHTSTEPAGTGVAGRPAEPVRDTETFSQPGGQGGPAAPEVEAEAMGRVAGSGAVAVPEAKAAAGDGTTQPAEGGDKPRPANPSAMSSFKTAEQAREELQKLQDLSLAMGEHSARVVQLFDSMIESHRALAQVQRAQHLDINAIQSQIRTLLALAGNAHFNTQ